MIGIGELEIAGRLLLGALLGGGIGLERQVHGRPAGFRTHLLVCVASVLLMTVSQALGGGSGGDVFRFDPGRLAYKRVTIVVDRDAPEEQLRAAVTEHGPRITAMDYELDAESGRMTYRITIASERSVSEREIVDAIARFPAVRHIRVCA